MDIRTPFEMRPGVPAYAAVRDVIRAEIMDGEISAGARLTTAFLVKRFGISQMPVREALQALEGEGLIRILPHKGATVLSLDSKRVGNIYDLRGAVEALLVRKCLPNITNAAMAELSEIHRVLKDAVDRGEPRTVFDLNTKFHSLIYRYAQNPEAEGVYDRYAKLLGTLRGRYGFSPFRMHQMVDEHDEILDALRRQDEAELDVLMRSHVEGAKLDLVSRIEIEEAAPPKTGTL